MGGCAVSVSGDRWQLACGALLLTLMAMTPMVAPQRIVSSRKQLQNDPQHPQEERPEQLSKQKPPKPHIVFILADDLGFNDVSWHNDAIFTPTLDHLARNGVILESSYTEPVCTPARAALLAGRYPHTIGRQGGALKGLQPTGLDPSLLLLPKALKRVGYSTHMVGKWHLGFCNWSYTPTRRGFDTFYGFYNSGGSYYTKIARTVFTVNNETQFIYGYDRRLQQQVYHTKKNEYSTFEFAQRARTIIQQHNKDRPLFMYLPFQAVHGPLEAPEPFAKLYFKIKDSRRRRYLGMVAALDEAVRTVVQALKEAGLYNNTVIVFTTDNGGSFKAGGNNWPLRGFKHTLYEGGVRGATFVHSPLLQYPGKIHNTLFDIVDWFPTLAGLAGASVPSSIDGVDQWDSLNFQGSPPRNKIISIRDGGGRLKASAREGNWKLLVGMSPCHGNVRPAEDVEKSTANYFAHRMSFFTHLLMQTNNKSWNFRDERVFKSRKDEKTGSVKTDEETLEDSDDIMDEYNDEFGDVDYQYSFRGKNSQGTHCEESRMRAEDTTNDHMNITQIKEQFLLNLTSIHIQLYNIRDDPNEKKDLSKSQEGRVQHLLDLIQEEVLRTVPVDDPPMVAEGIPSNFGGNWSPGWC